MDDLDEEVGGWGDGGGGRSGERTREARQRADLFVELYWQRGQPAHTFGLQIKALSV